MYSGFVEKLIVVNFLVTVSHHSLQNSVWNQFAQSSFVLSRVVVLIEPNYINKHYQGTYGCDRQYCAKWLFQQCFTFIERRSNCLKVIVYFTHRWTTEWCFIIDGYIPSSHEWPTLKIPCSKTLWALGIYGESAIGRKAQIPSYRIKNSLSKNIRNQHKIEVILYILYSFSS